MNRRDFVILTGASLSATALLGDARASVAGDDLATTLLRLESERQAAYVAGDRNVLEQQFALEYVHTNLHGGRTNREAELAFYAPGKFSLQSGAVEDVSTHQYGDVATLTATVIWENAVYRATPTTSLDLSGRFSVSRVYVFRDARWQLALSHASQLAGSR